MRAEPLSFAGVVLLRGEVDEDERGSFRRVVDLAQMDSLGLDSRVTQVSSAFNHKTGTVRGLHYQVAPHGESKTIWCTSGSVFDVVVDLRPDESTFGQWLSVELSGKEPVAIHLPQGVAHGYQTLEADTELVYLISAPFDADSARVLSFRDSTLAIPWPLPVASISVRDQDASSWPPL